MLVIDLLSTAQMLQRLADFLILEAVSIIYSTAVFCLKKRQA
jgi:hypothetical protein